MVDEAEIPLVPGTSIRLPAGCRHTVIARTAMTLIEVQVGKDISVEDKTKYPLDEKYGSHRG